MLTLYTTPVVYLYMDRFSTWRKQGRSEGLASAASPQAIG
jgi:hypothetical protein